ncbi:sensor histidine kinase [Bacillus safensis]|uniref:sensor histidine kinase n=1 Tax=Bacillus safensis TaxID=561879 RepID=UPI001C119485|nr:sensor histidine kinase [Bacillus safensis]MBU5208069.1 sensor histidine kinase [Bacillus safensis]MCY7433296.1 sensor histidine kinase [Bacillus safensis]
MVKKRIDPFNEMIYSRIPALLWGVLVYVAAMIFQFLTASLSLSSLFFSGLIAIHLILHWWSFYWFKKKPWIYFFIQGIVILLCVLAMQAASPVILIGLLPLLIAQSIGVYYHTLKIILTGLCFYVLFFLALILVNDTDDLTVYIPILFLILIVVVAYSILFFRQVKARIRTQTFLKELELAHQQVEELTLANERQRMARDLHDTLAQGLAGIIMQLEAVQAHLENQNTQRAQSIIKGSMSQARKTLGEARMVIDDLRKDRHDQYDLTETVKNEVNRFTTATNIPIRTKISVPQNMSPFFIEHTVYMIKECLTNVSKHAKASHVELVMVQQGDHIHLKIADNGVGFDEKKRESTFGHYGIIGMSERVRLLGGEIHLKSKKNEGTQVIVNIPLKKE